MILRVILMARENVKVIFKKKTNFCNKKSIDRTKILPLSQTARMLITEFYFATFKKIHSCPIRLE
jgi:hypothetical protein